MRIAIKKASKWYLSTVTWSLRNPKLYILSQNCLSIQLKSACVFTSSSSNHFSLFVQLLIACWFGADSLIFTPLIPPKKHWNHLYSCELFDILNLIFTSCCGKCPIVYCVHANSLKANNWFFSPMNEQYHPLVTITNNYPKSRTCKALLLQNLSN